MHLIFDGARGLLTFLLEHKRYAVPALSGFLVTVFGFLWTKLSLPNVRYMVRQDDRIDYDAALTAKRHSAITVLIKNMDSIPVPGVLIAEVTIHHPTLRFVRARHAAGPWAHAPHWLCKHEDPEFSTTVLLKSHGLPPDGAIQFELEANGMFPSEQPKNIVTVSLHPRSTMKVRSFTSLPKFSFWTSLRYFAARLLFGLVLYVFIVSQRLGHIANGKLEVGPLDTAIFLGGAFLVLAAWMSIMQFRGKDTVCGYRPSEWEPVSDAPPTLAAKTAT